MQYGFKQLILSKYIFHQDLSVRFWKIRHNLLSWLNAIPNIWKFVLQNESECYFRKFLCHTNLEFKVFVSHDTRIKIYFIINALYSLPFLEKKIKFIGRFMLPPTENLLHKIPTQILQSFMGRIIKFHFSDEINLISSCMDTRD